MADAYGKLTSRPQICFVTCGPAATDACHGVHIAIQVSTPMILLIEQMDTGMRERGIFQEIAYKSMFGSMFKWVAKIDKAERIPEFISSAFSVPLKDRPGTLVLSLPEDMLTEMSTVADSPLIEPVVGAPSPAEMLRLVDELARARRPLAIVGGSGWNVEGTNSFAQFAAPFGLPVARSFRRTSLFAATHPNYPGWIHRYHRYQQFARRLAPTNSSMDYGIHAAVMDNRQWPDKVVVCFEDDGYFLMNGKEFATAVQYDETIIIIIAYNVQ